MNIEKIIEILNEGKLIIIPTDTVYGISADATNPLCAKKVNEAKRRKTYKPLNILVSDMEMLKKYVKEITPLEEKIIQKFMPGKLTMLFKKNELISDDVTAGSKFIAIRIPDKKDLRELIARFNKPIISTSANITGEEIITDVTKIEDELLKNIDYVYDGGLLNKVASTLIKVENEKITFLREGEIAIKIKKEFKNYL